MSQYKAIIILYKNTKKSRRINRTAQILILYLYFLNLLRMAVTPITPKPNKLAKIGIG